MAKTEKIDADHPALPGHFPGRPIVPGALILERVLQAAAANFADAAACGVRRIKFLRPLSPEEAFWVEFDSPGASGVRFRVQTGGGAAADGQLVFRTAD